MGYRVRGMLFVSVAGLLLVLTAGCALLAKGSEATSTSEATRRVAEVEPMATFVERLTFTAAEQSPGPVVVELADPPGRIELPAGASAEVVRESSKSGGATETSESAKGETAVSGATELDVEAPKAELSDGPAASGGAIQAVVRALRGSSLWILHAIGGLCIVAGLLVMVFLKLPGKGLRVTDV